MKNQHIISKEVVPTELRLEVYKQALDRNWNTNVYGLCYILTMHLWGFSYETEAYDKIGHKYYNTEIMFPELVAEIPIINHSTDKNKLRENFLKRMIKKLENK